MCNNYAQLQSWQLLTIHERGSGTCYPIDLEIKQENRPVPQTLLCPLICPFLRSR